MTLPLSYSRLRASHASPRSALRRVNPPSCLSFSQLPPFDSLSLAQGIRLGRDGPYVWSGRYYTTPFRQGWNYQQYNPYTNQYFYQYRVAPNYGW